ncbi:methylated-DNA--[protein]-cysteine S-methyltransferase [Nocardioides sp.]|uniref:methylated-DNA--[protein]-cysteine S-methyltransferase n=1 Tax=Nocardioides sp. TaxID=35761 RepID=UPI002BA8D6CA|nr:methylated-DNA--[protein]-cysteine S-methyltransferase [Nocardioides sp.]HSX68381.1 methylated-DNA--[protein]-cysteine S-methyltransferase [Nocardioides sp.]
MWTVMESPVGELRVIERAGALSAIEFTPWRPPVDGRPLGERADDHPVLAATVAQLTEYFAGERTAFDLPVAPRGTEFQERVWAQLQKIAFGETASYGQVAARLGLTAAASRAVGTANGRNPIPIVIPCHRVIGADGSLTGYAGGMERKQVLLDLESADRLF